jgi:hypothetical protein
MRTPLHFPSPKQFPPFTMRDYFKSKFDYQWDTSGGWRFIAVPGSMSLNQQKLIPREQTPKQLPGNPRRALALAHKIYKTVFYLMEAGKVAAVCHWTTSAALCRYRGKTCWDRDSRTARNVFRTPWPGLQYNTCTLYRLHMTILATAVVLSHIPNVYLI